MYDILRMPQVVEIGYTGEHEFTNVQIDLTGWLDRLPEEERDGYVPSIVHIRPGETQADAYIVATTYDDGILSWEVQASDIGTHEGTGLAQVWLEEETNNTLNKLGMSTVFATIARQSISDGNPDIPDPQIPWLQQMTAMKTETVNAKIAAEAAETAAEEARDTAEEWATGGSGGTPSVTNNAKAYALKAEGFAVGTQDDVPVESGDPYYDDNAKYYAEQAADSSSDAADSASAAAQSASDADGYADTASGYATAAGNAQTAAETAQGKAEDAQAAAELAQSKAEDAQTAASTSQGKAEDAQTAAEAAAALAESWAVSESGGTPSATNNAEYYAEQAAQSAEGAAQAVQDAIDDTAGEGDTDKLWSADKLSALIDDTAGSGDTDKTWSADKINSVKLPSVSSSDNGKVLRVVNSSWVATELLNASGVSF